MSRKVGERVHNKVVFKEYNQKQGMLPLDIETLIPENHMVRIISRAIDEMDLKPLIAQYPGGGRASFHPAMMTKLIVYAYSDKIYSSRRIEKAARENIMYMWLYRGQTPDFKTINTFRSERMKESLLHIFSEVVELLIRSGHIKLENYFMDGTKIEANASKYSWVWGKATKNYKKKLQEKCREIFEIADLANKAEDESYGEEDLEELGESREIDSAAIEETVRRINTRLSDGKDSVVSQDREKLNKLKKTLERDCLPRMKKYEHQEKVLSERNSYSKTDTDATFMRMKEDHMGNGQLKPGYNVQIGTENQYVIGYSIHQHAGDTSCMKQHMEKLEKILGNRFPSNMVADAGYGSEENYEYLETRGTGCYVKYNTFHKEASRKWKSDPLKTQNWQYREEDDTFKCAGGRTLSFSREAIQKSLNGYRSKIRIYSCEDCNGCIYRENCIKSSNSEAVRHIQINIRGNELRNKAKQNLTSEYGLKMRKLRPVEVESVFGQIKADAGMRRFSLRGKSKVELEWGLHCIGHNFRKLAIALQ